MRYTSAKTAKELRLKFPEAVELPVPPGGWLTALRPMHDWALKRTHSEGFGAAKYAVVGRLDSDAQKDYAQFCFLSRDDADAFQAAFGGTRLTPQSLLAPRKKRTKSRYQPPHPVVKPEPRADLSDDGETRTYGPEHG